MSAAHIERTSAVATPSRNKLSRAPTGWRALC